MSEIRGVRCNIGRCYERLGYRCDGCGGEFSEEPPYRASVFDGQWHACSPACLDLLGASKLWSRRVEPDRPVTITASSLDMRRLVEAAASKRRPARDGEGE